jgi:hypothetical protein
MSDKVMQIPVNDLLDSLKSGYEEYRDCLEKNHDEDDLAHIKGFCTTIEQILASYGKVTKAEMLKIKKPIIGDISLRRKAGKIDYDIPTFIRKKQD